MSELTSCYSKFYFDSKQSDPLRIRKVKLGLEAQIEEEGLESPYCEMSQGVK